MKLRPPDNGNDQFAGHVSEPPWKETIQAQTRFQMTSSSHNIHCNIMRDSEAETPANSHLHFSCTETAIDIRGSLLF